MSSELWLFDAEGDVGRLQRSLHRHIATVVAMSDVNSLVQRETFPRALIIVTDSWRTEGKRKLSNAVQYAKSVPTIVVDHAFDLRVAKELASAGVHDYLDINVLTADRLDASLEFSVARHQHNTEDNMSPLINALPGRDIDAMRAIICDLPKRQREVFDLLASFLPPKELAEKLGTRCQTVHNQIAKLKQRFGVASRDELVVISVFYQPPPR